MSETDNRTFECIVITKQTGTIARVNIMNERKEIIEFVSVDVTPLFKPESTTSTGTILYYMTFFAPPLGGVMTAGLALAIHHIRPVEYEDRTPFRTG